MPPPHAPTRDPWGGHVRLAPPSATQRPGPRSESRGQHVGGRPDGGRQAADDRPRFPRDRARSALSELAPSSELGRGGPGRSANAAADRSCCGGVARAGSRPRSAVPRNPAPVHARMGVRARRHPRVGRSGIPRGEQGGARAGDGALGTGGAALTSDPMARRFGPGGAGRRGGGSLGDRLLSALRGQVAVRTGSRDPGETAR